MRINYQFNQPLIIAAVPIFILVVYFYCWFKKRSAAEDLVSQDLENWFISGLSRWQIFLSNISGVLWPVMIIIGLSGPQFFLNTSFLPLHNVGEIIILDASRSMTSEDDVFGEGGRFGAAKREIIEEFSSLSENKIRPRLGLVIFSGSSRRSLMLYDDYSVFLRQVSMASIFSPNDQGTNYEAALNDALSLCENAKDLIYCSVVLITDGDREAETPKLFTETLVKFREKKIRLDVVGVGKREAPLPSLGELGSPMEFRHTERGIELVPILTNYDEKFLSKITLVSGGNFYRFGEKGFLRKHLQNIRNTVESEVSEHTKRWMDISEYFYMIGTILLFGFLISHVPFKKINIFK